MGPTEPGACEAWAPRSLEPVRHGPHGAWRHGPRGACMEQALPLVALMGRGGTSTLMPLAVATLPPRVKELPAQGTARPRSLLLGLGFMSL